MDEANLDDIRKEVLDFASGGPNLLPISASDTVSPIEANNEEATEIEALITETQASVRKVMASLDNLVDTVAMSPIYPYILPEIIGLMISISHLDLILSMPLDDIKPSIQKALLRWRAQLLSTARRVKESCDEDKA